jgi:hypothetical protein
MADVESTIRAVEERLWRAQLSGDVEVLDELIADDLLFTGWPVRWRRRPPTSSNTDQGH